MGPAGLNGQKGHQHYTFNTVLNDEAGNIPQLSHVQTRLKQH